MKTMQRTLSLLLAMVMLLCCMVFAASAEEAASQVELYSAGKLVSGHENLQDALAVYDSTTQYVVLKTDITADITLAQDLYIDLAGYDLSGNLNLNGFKLYGMDSTTKEYSDANVGVLSAALTGGTPEGDFQNDAARAGNTYRYLAVQGENGYTFHRIYLGVTNVSLAPSVTGFGYKAEFYADATAQTQIQSVGYNLWLDGYMHVLSLSALYGLVAS